MVSGEAYRHNRIEIIKHCLILFNDMSKIPDVDRGPTQGLGKRGAFLKASRIHGVKGGFHGSNYH
jgi:hypothetical protein